MNVRTIVPVIKMQHATTLMVRMNVSVNMDLQEMGWTAQVKAILNLKTLKTGFKLTKVQICFHIIKLKFVAYKMFLLITRKSN